MNVFRHKKWLKIMPYLVNPVCQIDFSDSIVLLMADSLIAVLIMVTVF